jgi:hypothetical protein
MNTKAAIASEEIGLIHALDSGISPAQTSIFCYRAQAMALPALDRAWYIKIISGSP